MAEDEKVEAPLSSDTYLERVESTSSHISKKSKEAQDTKTTPCKGSFLALLCLAVLQFGLTTESILSYLRIRGMASGTGTYLTHLMVLFAVQQVGCFLSDFFINRRMMMLSCFATATASMLVGGTTYFIYNTYDMHLDTICIAVGFAWTSLARFAILRTIYDSAPVHQKQLWVGAIVFVVVATDATSSLAIGVWESTNVPALQIVVLVSGVAMLALVPYAINSEEFGKPATGAKDCDPKGCAFVRQIWALRKAWKDLKAAAPDKTGSFSSMLESVDPASADAMGALKFVLANAGILFFGPVLFGYAERMAFSQQDLLRQVFHIPYDNLMIALVSICAVPVFVRYKMFVKFPVCYYIAVGLAILACGGQIGLQAFMDSERMQIGNCKDESYVVVYNMKTSAINVSVGDTPSVITANGSKGLCLTDHDAGVLMDRFNFGHSLDTFREAVANNTGGEKGTFLLLTENGGDSALLTFDRVQTKKIVKLYEKGAVEPLSYEVHSPRTTWDHSLPYWSCVNYSMIGGSFAVLDPDCGRQNDRAMVELVPPYHLDVWWMFPALVLTGLSFVYAYWVYFNTVLMAPQEVGATVMGLSYFGPALGFVCSEVVVENVHGWGYRLVAGCVITVVILLVLAVYNWTGPGVSFVAHEHRFHTVAEDLPKENAAGEP